MPNYFSNKQPIAWIELSLILAARSMIFGHPIADVMKYLIFLATRGLDNKNSDVTGTHGGYHALPTYAQPPSIL